MAANIIINSVTENYKFQSFSTEIAAKKEIKKGEMTPLYPLVVQYNNTNYKEFRQNREKYTFVYDFDLEDFMNPTKESVSRARFISHAQVALNYYTDLITPKRGILTPGYIKNSPHLSKKLSRQYGSKGITLGVYNDSIINGLPEIIKKYPFNLRDMADFHPVFDVIEYKYIDLLGNETKKTATFGTIKYSFYDKSKNRTVYKVLFWGTGLQEFIIK
jgi:hypothetical protein